MDFTLTEEQELLVETAARLLRDECSPSMLRAHMDNPGAAAPLWAQLEAFTELGDGPCTDLALFCEQLGYVAAPGPFFAVAALYRPLRQVLGIHDERTGTVADGGVYAPDADQVDVIAVIRDHEVMFATDASTRLVPTADSTRRLFAIGREPKAGDTVAIADDQLREWRSRAWVAAAADAVGTARRMLDMSVAYAKERVQFGVPIGSFQAIQHKLADLALTVERATSAVRYAALTIDERDADRFRAAHVAKAAANAAAHQAGKDGVQVHGGIGYTWEHDLHLFIRRAEGSAHWMGTVNAHHDAIADILFA